MSFVQKTELLPAPSQQRSHNDLNISLPHELCDSAKFGSNHELHGVILKTNHFPELTEKEENRIGEDRGGVHL